MRRLKIRAGKDRIVASGDGNRCYILIREDCQYESCCIGLTKKKLAKLIDKLQRIHDSI